EDRSVSGGMEAQGGGVEPLKLEALDAKDAGLRLDLGSETGVRHYDSRNALTLDKPVPMSLGIDDLRVGGYESEDETLKAHQKLITTNEYAGARPKSEPHQSEPLSKYQSKTRRKTSSLERKSRRQDTREAPDPELEQLRDQVA